MHRIQPEGPTKISKEIPKQKNRKGISKKSFKRIPTTKGHEFSEWKGPLRCPSKGHIKKRTITRCFSKKS